MAFLKIYILNIFVQKKVYCFAVCMCCKKYTNVNVINKFHNLSLTKNNFIKYSIILTFASHYSDVLK